MPATAGSGGQPAPSLHASWYLALAHVAGCFDTPGPLEYHPTANGADWEGRGANVEVKVEAPTERPRESSRKPRSDREAPRGAHVQRCVGRSGLGGPSRRSHREASSAPSP